MIIFLALLLLPSSLYPMLDFPQNDEELFQSCQEGLQTYYGNYIPAPPCLGLILLHPGFLEFMQEVAGQDALWLNRPDEVFGHLVHIIGNRTGYFSNKPLVARVLDTFLTAAEQRGRAQFINSSTRINEHRILSISIEKNNLECAEVALKHKASLGIQCYSKEDRKHYYPLKFACKQFGPNSPMVQLLREQGATLLPEDKDLLFSRIA